MPRSMRFSHFHHLVWENLKPIVQQLRNNQWVVGVSGGMDSGVLAHVLWDLRFLHRQEISFIGVDHGHRVFDREEEVLQRYPFPVQIKRVQIDKNSEAEFREERYRALHGPNEEKKIVFTAHHQGDLIETVLMKLLRGGGILSFQSLPLVNWELRRVRLLRNISREMIQEFANSRFIPYVEDPTNNSLRYTRNEVRQILQKLGPLGKNLGTRLVELSDQAEELSHLREFVMPHGKKMAGKERNARYYRNAKYT